MSAPDSVAGKLSLTALNAMDLHEALERCGGFFEHSPWIAERALAERPFSTVRDFHAACMRAVEAADEPATVELIQSHPDLVGRLAREGRLTAESTREQAAAGLGSLTEGEIEAFERYNAEYRARFGFPFVICARTNRKEAILSAFPARLRNDRKTEIETAIEQIGEIAWLRMSDAISEGADEWLT